MVRVPDHLSINTDINVFSLYTFKIDSIFQECIDFNFSFSFSFFTLTPILTKKVFTLLKQTIQTDLCTFER